MWTKDGGELPDLDRMIVEGRELTFTSLNKTDNGTYRCEAGNHLGTSSAEYVLYVYGELNGKADVGSVSFPKVEKLQEGKKAAMQDALNSDNATKKGGESMNLTGTRSKIHCRKNPGL